RDPPPFFLQKLNTAPPPARTLCRFRPPWVGVLKRMVVGKFGDPVTKSRTSKRRPRWETSLKSKPPPYCRAPLLVVGPASAEYRAQPPPKLIQGAIGAPGATFNRNDGVMKTDDI